MIGILCKKTRMKESKYINKIKPQTLEQQLFQRKIAVNQIVIDSPLDHFPTIWYLKATRARTNNKVKASTVRLVTYQNIERSDVSTNISTKESTIFVWKMIVFIIFPSSLWSARLSEALETLV